MSSDRPRTPLRGRRAECEALDGLLERARGGDSAALVLRGEAGIGKTALLEYVVEQATPTFRVERAGGVESEMEMPFAGMHQLCAPMLDHLDRLPGPQREALRTAFGLFAGGPPDQFLVALAVLSLLSEVAEQQPLLCVVDDAQWLDGVSAQALAFVARRLLADPIALVFAVREPSRRYAGLPELEVGGLRNGAARALLGSAVQGRLDDSVRDRLVAETKGNPLALLELPRGLTAAELAGGFGLPAGALPLTGRIEQSFQRRFEQLPQDTQQLVLVGAADPTGDPGLLWRAAESLGLSMDALNPAQAADLMTVGGRVEFHHPLVRSAIYRDAAIEDRRTVHRALADVIDVRTDPDHRAWHLAQAATDPDEEVAAELERSAGRARARGGLAAAAAIRERAAMLTPDPDRWIERTLVAAQTTYEAGSPDAALRMLAAVDARPLTPLQRATLERLRAQIAFTLREGSHAPGMLLSAAEHLAPLDPGHSRVSYLEALEAATYAGRLAAGGGIAELAQAARTAPPAPAEPGAVDHLLQGLVAWSVDGYAASVPPFQQALGALRDERTTAGEGMRWLWLAGHIAVALWDDGAWHALVTRQMQLARDAGALTVLPFALNSGAGLAVLTGDFAGADALLDESLAITTATGNPPMAHPAPVLAAWRGQQAEATALIGAAIGDATARGDGRQITLAEYAVAVLHNGLSDYEAAFAAAREAARHDELGLQERILPELVEAAVRTGERDVALEALATLRERTEASGTHWALGVEAYSRALLDEGDGADALYQEAIEHLGRSRIAGQRARVHLLYGEWLRRRRRRVDAREQLHIAHDTFAAMGATAFAERARIELLATGASARKRTEGTRDALTPQEAQVARLAAGGAANSDIAAQLFISPSTVAYHLRKVFRKLDISSRRQIPEALGDAGVSAGH